MSHTNTLWIAFLGAVGVACRYLVDMQIGQWTFTDFPLSTFAINCAGSFAIGVLYILGHESGIVPKELAMSLTVGLLGGFTTFSAFSIQTFQLIERGKIAIAASYFIGSPLLGLMCASGGVYLARTIWGQQ